MRGLLIGLVIGCLICGCSQPTQYTEPTFVVTTTQVSPQETKPDLTYLERTHFSVVRNVLEAHWMRVWITWGEVEREEGVFDFSYTDKIVEKAQENDILLLITVMPFAEWDQDRCRGDECYGKMPMPEGITTMKVCKPCSMDDYIEFLKKFVERYDGDGVDDMPGFKYPIKYWEVMNEPGMRGLDVTQLKFFYGSPQDYLEILKSSYAAIKESDPEAKVVMGGMAGMHKQFREFWGQIISEAGNYFDVANIHSIDTSERREDMFVLSFKQFLEEHGVENKPIWITEAQFGKLGEPLPPDELDPPRPKSNSSVTRLRCGQDILHLRQLGLQGNFPDVQDSREKIKRL